MATSLFADFLDSFSDYAASQQYWEQNVWNQIDPFQREIQEWRVPWFENQFNDGNPIFSAVSESERKAIRVLQFPPDSNHIELHYWVDAFGGSIWHQDSITELVISCSLSEEAAYEAMLLMEQWVTTGSIQRISNQSSEADIRMVA